MKTKKKLLIALLSATCITAGAFGLAACKDDSADYDTQKYAAYQLYADAAGDGAMSYEQWLETIKGPAGPAGTNGTNGKDGTNGTDGATWLTGASDPEATKGKKGDMFLNTTTFDIFLKGDTAWDKLGNIKGANGSKGDEGAAGGKGDKGEAGSAWLTGTADPTAETAAKQGDFYLNTTSGDVFAKGETAWEKKGNIKGAIGETGASIVEVDLQGNELLLIFDDDTPEHPHYLTITLPEEVVHEHYYGVNPKVTTVIQPTDEVEGIGYKACEYCDHIELVVIDPLGGEGTEERPFIIFKEGDVTFEDDASYVYYQYTATEDCYFVVTRTSKEVEIYNEYMDYTYKKMLYSSGFYVYNETYMKTNNETDRTYTANDTDRMQDPYDTYYLAKGDKAIVNAFQISDSSREGPIDEEKGSFNVHIYSATKKYEHTINLKNSDGGVVAGATVQAYTRERDEEENDVYTAVEGASAVSDKDGNAVISLPLTDNYEYYFSVTVPEDSEYLGISCDSKKLNIGYYQNSNYYFDFSLSVTLQKVETFNITVKYGEDGETPAEGVVVKFIDNSAGSVVIGQGTVDSTGVATIKCSIADVDYGYIELENLPDGWILNDDEEYEFAEGELFFDGEIILVKDPTVELTLSDGTNTINVDLNAVYKLTVEAGKTYTIATSTGAYIYSMIDGRYTLISSSGRGTGYTSMLSPVYVNSQVTQATLGADFEGDTITFKISGGETFTITVADAE